MDNQSQSNILSNQPSFQDRSSSSTNWSRIAIFILLLLLIIVGSIIIGISIGQNKTVNKSLLETSEQFVTPTLTSIDSVNQPEESKPTVNKTSDWKLFSSEKYSFSFKYPDDYQVEERSDGFFVIILPSEKQIPQAGVSIDARGKSPMYNTYNEAEQWINLNNNINQEKIVNNWKIFTMTGKEGMTKGIKFVRAIISYKDGVMSMETIDNQPYNNLIEQIISTFEFK